MSSKQFKYAGDVLGITPSAKPIVEDQAEQQPQEQPQTPKPAPSKDGRIAGEVLEAIGADGRKSVSDVWRTRKDVVTPLIDGAATFGVGAGDRRVRNATPVLVEVDGVPVTKHIPDRELKASELESKGTGGNSMNEREWLSNRLSASSKSDRKDYKLQLDSEQMDRARLAYNGAMVRAALEKKYGETWANATRGLDAIKNKYSKLLYDADPMQREELRVKLNDELNAELTRLTNASDSNYYLTEAEQRTLFGDNAPDDDYLRNTYLATGKVRGSNEADTPTAAKTMWGIKNLYNIENNPVVQGWRKSSFENGKEKVADPYMGATENYVTFDGKDYVVKTANYNRGSSNEANGFGKPDVYSRRFRAE